jgi:hypothetical protein
MGGLYMQDLSLEFEFNIYKMVHKTTILQAKMTNHFRDLQETGIQIPFFMQKSPEKRAEEEVQNLLERNKEAFESLYLSAWNEYAECLP